MLTNVPRAHSTSTTHIYSHDDTQGNNRWWVCFLCVVYVNCVQDKRGFVLTYLYINNVCISIYTLYVIASVCVM